MFLIGMNRSFSSACSCRSNWYGRDEFYNGPEAINIHEIVRELSQFPVWQVMTSYV
jgi:hypothetical protein